jgi:hypothetical protein
MKRGFMSDKDPEYSAEEEFSPEEEGEAPARKPALVLNVYSWWTPILAIVMLVAGLAIGYVGRPYLSTRYPETSGTNPEVAAPTTEPTIAGTPSPTADPTQVAETRERMMEFLTGQARHYLGDENAPIVMIEFSDFQ